MPLDAASGESIVDVREIPPGSRHPLIFGTFDRLRAEGSFVLVNDHDPQPLRRAFGMRYGDGFSVEYLESGPEVWRVRFRKLRTDSCCGGGCGG
jgi:uncharacterized protein (DUF2249 family)